MFATPPVEDIAIVREVPDFVVSYWNSNRGIDVILNEPDKRSHKSTEDILLQSAILSIGIEFDKIRNLYSKYRNLFIVDFSTFFGAYIEMSELMMDIVPEDCDIVTEVSVENECLYSYYEYDDKKIFFNLFFDEEENSPIAQANIQSNGNFNSVEGTIETVAFYLKNLLQNNPNV